MKRPSRRRLLAALCTSSGALLAGCTNDSATSNTTATTEPETMVPETTDPGSDSSDADTGSSPKFPDDTQAAACPPFDDVERAICEQAVDPDDVPAVLVGEHDALEPGASMAATLHNQSEQRFETNNYHWRLYKRVEGDWYYIAPQQWVQPLTPVAAGGSHTWTVSVEEGGVADGETVIPTSGSSSLSFTGLGGGHYAFGTDGNFESQTYEEKVGLATGFELRGDPLPLTVTNAVEGVEWSGETLQARSSRGDDNTDRSDVAILERLDSPEGKVRRLIVEQVVRNNQLRDTIALSREYDTDRVRLADIQPWTPSFRVDEDQVYEFRGEYYRLTVGE